jgi:hypothetical protein
MKAKSGPLRGPNTSPFINKLGDILGRPVA